VESCTAIIHTTHTYTHTCTHTHTLLFYIGFFDQNEVKKIIEEGVKMKQFNHPNVMSLIGLCIDAGPAPYIIMPFMANGSLLSYLRRERPNLLLNETADEDLVRVCNITHVRNIYIWMHANIASAALLEHCVCSHCEAARAQA